MSVTEALLARKKELELEQPKTEIDQVEETVEPKVLEASDVKEEETEVIEEQTELKEEPVSQEVPNFTYSVKGETREFEDWVKPLINKENEEKFRDHFTKLGGFDSYKQKASDYEEKLKHYEEEFTGYVSEAQNLAQKVVDFNKGITSSSVEEKFNTLKSVGLNEDQILQLAQYAISVKEMPIEQKRIIEERNQFLNQKAEYENKYLNAENRYKELLVSQHKASISNAVQNHRDIADLYDTQKGQGKFVEDVERFGLWNAQNGFDMSYDQAVSEFIRLNGLQPQVAQAPSNQQIQQPKKIVAPLPNLSGSGTSPIKKAVSSLNDLKALAEKHI